MIGVIPLSMSTRLGIAPGDTEGVIDTLLNTTDVELACLVREVSSFEIEFAKSQLRRCGEFGPFDDHHGWRSCACGWSQVFGTA